MLYDLMLGYKSSPDFKLFQRKNKYYKKNKTIRFGLLYSHFTRDTKFFGVLFKTYDLIQQYLLVKNTTNFKRAKLLFCQ